MAGSVSGIKAGKAFVMIEAIDATGKILNQVRNRLGKFGTELSNIGRTMALRAIAALTPGAFAVKQGTDYDDIMRKVEARSEGTAAEMEVLRQQTLSLGKALGILPSQLGGIQNIFAQAGFSRKDIADIAPAVAMLSRAGGEGADAFGDTENAAKAVSAVLRGFDMDASATKEVVDKLAVALNASNFNLEDITTSLQYAVPAAKFYNVTLEETLAILGAMRDLQIDASIAGTAFRNMMMYMSQKKEQDKFNEELKALTGNTIEFTDALGNLHSPLKILPAMLKATEGLGTAQRSNLIGGILQARATIPGAAVGRSIERMEEMLAALGKAGGTAARIQKFMDAGLGGAFRRLMSEVSRLAIEFQKALAPALLTAADAIDTFLKTTTDWISQNQGLTATIVAVTVGSLALGAAIVVLGQAIISASGFFGLLALVTGTFMTAITTVIGLVSSFAGIVAAAWSTSAVGVFALIAAIVAVPVALVAFEVAATSAGELFCDIAREMSDEWGMSFKNIVDRLKSGDLIGAFNVLSAQIQFTWQKMINALLDMWDGFWQQFAEFNASQGSDWLVDLLSSMPGISDEYIQSLRDTYRGQQAEAMNGPDAQARAERVRERERQLEELRKELQAIRENTAPLKQPTSQPKNNSTFKPKLNPEQLIGAGGVLSSPKKALEAQLVNNGDALRAFIENKFAATEDKGIELAKEANELLANIDAGIKGLGMGIV